MHPATTYLLTTTALGRNSTPSTSTTTLCPEKNIGTKTWKLWTGLFPSHTWVVRFVLSTDVIVSTSTCGPIGCPVSPRFLSSQNVQSHENSHTNCSARGETPTISLALDTNSEGRERVKVKASRIQCSRIGSALVCVRRDVRHR